MPLGSTYCTDTAHLLTNIMLHRKLQDLLEGLDGVLPSYRIPLQVAYMVVCGEHNLYGVVGICPSRGKANPNAVRRSVSLCLCLSQIAPGSFSHQWSTHRHCESSEGASHPARLQSGHSLRGRVTRAVWEVAGQRVADGRQSQRGVSTTRDATARLGDASWKWAPPRLFPLARSRGRSPPAAPPFSRLLSASTSCPRLPLCSYCGPVCRSFELQSRRLCLRTHLTRLSLNLGLCRTT